MATGLLRTWNKRLCAGIAVPSNPARTVRFQGPTLLTVEVPQPHQIRLARRGHDPSGLAPGGASMPPLVLSLAKLAILYAGINEAIRDVSRHAAQHGHGRQHQGHGSGARKKQGVQ